jgi:hypothetical protein
VARKRAYLYRRAGLSALLEDSVCCGASGNSFIRGMAPSGVLVLAESRRGPHRDLARYTSELSGFLMQKRRSVGKSRYAE